MGTGDLFVAQLTLEEENQQTCFRVLRVDRHHYVSSV
jgi:hypothetical protein